MRFVLCLMLVSVGAARRIANSTEGVDNVTEISSTEHPHICHYSDPDIANCIKKMAEQAREVLAHGIPSLNIQPLEPLKVPNIRLRQHNAPKLGFKFDAWFSDVELRGLTNYTFNKLDVYPEDLKVVTNISLPHLTMTGEYVVIGEFQMLPVESTGKMAANFTQCTAFLEAVGAKVHKRIVVRDANVKLKCSVPQSADLMEAHSTSNEMEMITHHLVGMHSSEIAKEVQPSVETALVMVLEDIANKFLKRIPPNMVFPN